MQWPARAPIVNLTSAELAPLPNILHYTETIPLPIQAASLAGMPINSSPGSQLGPENESSGLVPAIDRRAVTSSILVASSVYMKEGTVTLPSSAWNRRDMCMEGVESVCFAELRKPLPESPAFIFKNLEVTVHAGKLKVSQYILEREVGSTVYPLHPMSLSS